MADNVTLPGTGGVIASDEVAVNGGTTAQVQFVKLVDGTSNGVDGLPGSATLGLAVAPRRDLLRIDVNSAGLTTTATAYTAGDQVGNQFTFANCARASGGGGTIVGVLLVSAADTITPMDLVISRASMTLAADNAAYAISDADALNIVGLIQLAGAWDLGANRICQAFNLAVPYTCSATSLFGSLITRGAIAATPFAATTDIQLSLFVERN